MRCKSSRFIRSSIGSGGALAVTMIMAVPFGDAVRAASLQSAEITELVSGSTVNIDTPLDVPLPLRFEPDGSLHGTAGKLEFYLKTPTDQGKWWVADNQLCQKWRRWFDAKTTCLSLSRDGGKYAWVRDDGTKGTASIVAKPPSIVAMIASKLAPAAPTPRGLGGPEAQAEDQTAKAVSPVVKRLATAPTAAAPTASMRTPVAPGITPKILAARAAIVPPRAAESAPVVAAVPAVAEPARQTTAVNQASGVRGITYRVVKVAANDTLNVRGSPNDMARVLGTVPPNGRGLTMLGSCAGYWCPVRYGAMTGWVSRYYLELEPMTVSAR